MEYKSWEMAIIIVLTGLTDKNLLKDLGGICPEGANIHLPYRR